MGGETYDFDEKVTGFLHKTVSINPLTFSPNFFVSLGFYHPSFAPEHIPWLAGPVSVPGRTVRQGVSRFTSGSLTRGSGFVNGIGEVVTEA